MQSNEQVNARYKIDEIVNKFLLTGNKFKTTWIYIQSLWKETRDSRYIYQNKLNKACFQHGMTHRDFKYVTRRTASDKILHDKTFNIAKNPKYDGCQSGVASKVCKCFDKKNVWWCC